MSEIPGPVMKSQVIQYRAQVLCREDNASNMAAIEDSRLQPVNRSRYVVT